MIKIDEIKKQVAIDIIVDRKNLSHTAARVPILHSKYLSMLNESHNRLIVINAEFDRVYAEKYLYYRNDYKVVLKTKGEIEVMCNADKDVQLCRIRLEYEKEVSNYLEYVIKQIQGIGFLVKDIIQWEIFQAGG